MGTTYKNIAVSDNTRNVVFPQIKKTVENVRANNPVKQDNLKKESEYMRQLRIRERQGNISQGYKKSNWEQQQSQQKMQQLAEAERQAKERAEAEAVVSGAMRYLFPSNYIGALTTNNANGFAERLMYVGDKRNQGLFENNTFLSDSDKEGLNLAFDIISPALVSKALNVGLKTGRNVVAASSLRGNPKIQLNLPLQTELVIPTSIETLTYFKPWKSAWTHPENTRYNMATSYALRRDPHLYLEVVSDAEPGYKSLHFKMDGNMKNNPKISLSEKEAMFNAAQEDIRPGYRFSTYGNVSRGGVSGLDKVAKMGDFEKVGERLVLDKTGNNLVIPIYEKPYFNAMGLRRTATPYQGTEEQLNQKVIDGVREGYKHRFSPKKAELIKQALGWSDADIAELYGEYSNTMGFPTILFVNNDFSDLVGSGFGTLEKVDGQYRVYPKMTLNVDRVANDNLAFALGVHEIGGHTATVNIKPESIGRGIIGRGLLALSNAFPKITELLQYNKKMADNTLRLNSYGEFISLPDNVIINKLKNSGMSDTLINLRMLKILNDRREMNYFKEGLEISARGLNYQVHLTVKPTVQLDEVQLYHKYFTPESTTAALGSILSVPLFINTSEDKK